MNEFNYLKAKNDNKIILAPQSEIDKTYKELPPNFYDVKDVGSMFKEVLAFIPIEDKDNLIEFKSGVFEEVMNKCINFFSDETIILYKEINIFQKMGMLLYGPPGTGKTCTAVLVMKELIAKYNAIALDFTNTDIRFATRVINKVRKNQDNPIILFIDEIDTSIKNQENDFLTLMDGTDSYKNLIILGCTNYYEKIPKRFTERKSRIKHSFEIKSLPESIYKQYILTKIPKIAPDKLEALTYHAIDLGLTIDELKHAIINYYIEKMSVEDAIKEAKSYAVVLPVNTTNTNSENN